MAEHPGLSLTPAIVNGIADATGAWVSDIPATPNRVKAKLASIWAFPKKLYFITCDWKH